MSDETPAGTTPAAPASATPAASPRAATPDRSIPAGVAKGLRRSARTPPSPTAGDQAQTTAGAEAALGSSQVPAAATGPDADRHLTTPTGASTEPAGERPIHTPTSSSPPQTQPSTASAADTTDTSTTSEVVDESQEYEPKWTLLRQAQLDELDDLAKRLNRARPRVPGKRHRQGERITENVLIRIAVDLLLDSVRDRTDVEGITESDLARSIRGATEAT